MIVTFTELCGENETAYHSSSFLIHRAAWSFSTRERIASEETDFFEVQGHGTVLSEE